MIHVRDVIRKVERDYKLISQNNTVEYQLKGLEPGGRYSVSVRLRNMSKEASFTLSTGTQDTSLQTFVSYSNHHINVNHTSQMINVENMINKQHCPCTAVWSSSALV